MTEQEQWELKFRQQMELLMLKIDEIVDIVSVMDANGWTSPSPVSAARYSVAHMVKFLENDSPDANTHGINLDKARLLP